MTNAVKKLEYYYENEAEEYLFYKVPQMLFTDKRFSKISSDAKLLYSLFLNRMSLSRKNGMFDEEKRVYIYFSIEEIMEVFGIASQKATKIIAELDSKKGIGLIEKKRQGLGKPDIIYVKNFVAVEPDTKPKKTEKEPGNTDVSTEVQNLNVKKYKKQTSRSSKSELQEIQKTDVKKFNNYTSGSSENELAEVQESNSNYNNNSYTDISYNNPINQSATEKPQDDVIDSMDDAQAYIELIKENINYDHHMKYDGYGEKELYDELFGIICEVVCVKRKSIRVAGEDYPYELVKSRFLKLNSSHLEYVIGCMKETTTKITNIKAYMITALYNAPTTINHFYQQEVQHDMYGGGWHEKGIV